MKYDKKKVYDEKIAPLVQSLIQACNEEKIPAFVTVAVRNTEDDTEYVSGMVSAFDSNIRLENDKFTKLVNVMNGFDTVPHVDIVELEYN